MRICALTVSKRPHLIQVAGDILARQKRKPDAWHVIMHGQPLPDGKPSLPGSTIDAIPSSTALGAVRNQGLRFLFEQEAADVVQTVDDDDWYGPEFLALLEKSIEKHPEGMVFGIREYELGFVDNKLRSDGSNIVERMTSNGGKALGGDRVDWVCDATIAMTRRGWDLGLRYGERVAGECELIMSDCRTRNYPVITRDREGSFTAVRVLHADGHGGSHRHTWGPIVPAAPVGWRTAAGALRPTGGNPRQRQAAAEWFKYAMPIDRSPFNYIGGAAARDIQRGLADKLHPLLYAERRIALEDAAERAALAGYDDLAREIRELA